MTTLDSIQCPLYDPSTQSADEYEMVSGAVVLPIAQTPPTSESALGSWSPVVVLQLHAPYRIRRTRTSSQKTNNPPVVPSPQDTGKFVFLGGTLTIQNMMNSRLDTFDWFVGSDYTFVENCVSRVQDGYVLTSMPWAWMTTASNLTRGTSTAVSSPGAVGQAGTDAKVGYNQASSIDLNGTWGYNTSTYFPGNLFNETLINGGPTYAGT